MDIIKIDLTPEQIDALAPLQALIQQAYNVALQALIQRANDAEPAGKKPFLPPLGMVLAQLYLGESNQMHCAYVPPEKAAGFYNHFKAVMGIK